MKTVKKVTLLVIAAAVLFGCIFAAGCTGDSTPDPVLTISVAKTGGYTYGPGDEFTIELPSNPSTGYMWVVSQVSEGLNARENAVQTESSGMVGVPTKQSFTFSAPQEGVYQFTLSYQRSGEDAGIYVYSDLLLVENGASNNGKFVFDGTYVPSVGDLIQVKVADISASTGYTWAIASSDAEAFSLVGTKTVTASTAVGAAGVKVWTFKANQPGVFTLVAQQQKGSGDQTEIGNAFFVPVTVQPATA